MPSYRMSAPNGQTYTIEGPPGATDDQVRAEILRQYPQAENAPAPKAAAKVSVPMDVIRGAGADMASGFAAPFKKAAADFGDSYRKSVARGRAGPPSLVDAATGAVSDIGDAVRNAGDVAATLGAPLQAVIRPAADALSRIPGVQAYSRPSLGLNGIMPVINGAQPLDRAGTQGVIEDGVNTALSAAAPAVRGAVAGPPRPQVQPSPSMTLDELQAAKNAAYAKVDASGAAYHPQAFGDMVDGITSDLNSANLSPIRHPRATSMLSDIQGMKGQSPTLTQVDQLRQVVNRDVGGSPDPAEQFFGRKMADRIDAFVNGAGPADMAAGSAPDAADAIQNARDLNTRYRKVQEVSNRVDSAGLRADSTYSGGNVVNATRQNLRPLIDPKSPQRMGNLTPDEMAALSGIVRGTPATNAVRLAGKVLDPRGLLGASVQSAMGIPSHGMTLATAPLGIAATQAGKAMTAKQVDDLLALMGRGGSRAASQNPTGTLLSIFQQPRTLPGLAVLASPPAGIPSRQAQ